VICGDLQCLGRLPIVPVRGNGRYHVFALLFLSFFLFYTSTSPPKPNSKPKLKLEEKNDQYLEGIEAKFQRDPLRSFEIGALYYNYNQWLGKSTVVEQERQSDLLHGVASRWALPQISSVT